MAFSPLVSSSAWKASSPFWFLSKATTRAPSWAKRSTVARPMPDPAPVTMAVFPWCLVTSMRITPCLCDALLRPPKNRSRKDSSVSSLPSVRSTASWLISHLPQADFAKGRPALPIRRNWAI
jgi:hypothetical protein